MLGASVANYCIAASRREIRTAPKLKTAKEQRVTRASDSGPLQKKSLPPKKKPRSRSIVELPVIMVIFRVCVY